MKRHVWFIVIFKLSILTNLSAQNLQESFALAQQLASQQQYEEALNIFERVVYFDSTSYYRKDCFLAIAEAYKNLGDLANAIKYYNLSYYLAEAENEQREIQFQLVAARLLQQDFISVQEDLFVLEEMLRDEDQKRFFFYKGISAFASGSFDSAEVYFAKYLGPVETMHHIKLSQLFLRNDKISKLNPKSARILSIIIPGLGQFYAGDIKNGLNSLILSAGILTLAIHLGINASFWDAMLSATPWYARYYQGGYKAAETITEEKIAKKRSELFQQLMDLLIKKGVEETD